MSRGEGTETGTLEDPRGLLEQSQENNWNVLQHRAGGTPPRRLLAVGTANAPTLLMRNPGPARTPGAGH